MNKILFVNACVRPNSRTLELAKAVLERLEGEIEEIRLFEEGPTPLTGETLALRDKYTDEGDFSHPMFRWAKQFAQADEIVIAAPYWDLMFPAVVRSYFESVTASGVTFDYQDNGIPKGFCRAKRLIYVTTSGGPIFRNFGFEYTEALARSFYGIPETVCIKAEGLDIWGADTAAILQQAKNNILL